MLDKLWNGTAFVRFFFCKINKYSFLYFIGHILTLLIYYKLVYNFHKVGLVHICKYSILYINIKEEIITNILLFDLVDMLYLLFFLLLLGLIHLSWDLSKTIYLRPWSRDEVYVHSTLLRFHIVRFHCMCCWNRKLQWNCYIFYVEN